MFTKQSWTPLAAPPGYALELDTSRPNGPLRHRKLPDGEWQAGPIIEGITSPLDQDAPHGQGPQRDLPRSG